MADARGGALLLGRSACRNLALVYHGVVNGCLGPRAFPADAFKQDVVW